MLKVPFVFPFSTFLFIYLFFESRLPIVVSTAECALVQLRSIRLAAALRGVNCVIKGRGKGGAGEKKNPQQSCVCGLRHFHFLVEACHTLAFGPEIAKE